MDKVLNYIFIGFTITFLLDYISEKYKNHQAFKDVPEWDWGARIMFALFWPLGTIIFIYVFLKEYFK
tara:strand:- start:426 stop:626 length:201 start_codon:yes stop_codon:yes gene_type:complete